MSTIWTPSGEHEPTRPTRPGPADPPRANASGEEAEPAMEEVDAGTGEAPDAELEAELRQARAELAAVPVADIVANHAIGLWQLAVLHLTPEPGPDGAPVPPRLDEARLAIDAFAALVESLGDRLAPHVDALREALTQLRLAYVQLGAAREE